MLYDERTSTHLSSHFLNLPQADNINHDIINFLHILFHSNYKNETRIHI